jgi:hypothetical protein
LLFLSQAGNTPRVGTPKRIDENFDEIFHVLASWDMTTGKGWSWVHTRWAVEWMKCLHSTVVMKPSAG